MAAQVAVFRGDALDLLDRLVEACNSKPKHAAGPLKERELQRFDFEAWDLPPPSCSSSSAKKQQQHGGSSNKRAVSPPAAGGNNNKSPSGSPPRTKPKTPGHPNNNANDINTSLFAGNTGCPGFFTSPKPEALPQPSSTLMLRALSMKVKA